jgi:uncharacterized protein YjbI with pentapeptide repeats
MPTSGGANLDGANLDGANLEGANLGRALLDGAIVEAATFRNAAMQGSSLGALVGEASDWAGTEGGHRAHFAPANRDRGS